ncbi:MAG: tetratricopeptide repeat protein, partial [Acidimicrobiales bacterium]
GPKGARATRSSSTPLSPEVAKRQRDEEFARSRGWGGVARRGAANISSTGREMAGRASSRVTPAESVAWIADEEPARRATTPREPERAPLTLPGDLAAEVRRAFTGTAHARERTVVMLAKAAAAYDRHRFEEALRLSRGVVDAVPGVAPVRELAGLAAYRAERWPIARTQLRAHFELTGDAQHLPLVMDCDRAAHRWRAVERTFATLSDARPSADVLTEARIVQAAAWADQRRFAEAVELLVHAGGQRNLRNPGYRHVRLWYALGDVYDRAGDATSARELFSRVVRSDPDAYDARDRLAELGSSTPSKNRRRRTTPVSTKRVD